MASRPEIKAVPRTPAPDDVAATAPSQHAPKDIGPYRLQVDRQTKATYRTQEEAEAAGLLIKQGHPIVQVSIYNSAAGVNMIIELPPA